jgi:hypothetical protein
MLLRVYVGVGEAQKHVSTTIINKYIPKIKKNKKVILFNRLLYDYYIIWMI